MSAQMVWMTLPANPGPHALIGDRQCHKDAHAKSSQAGGDAKVGPHRQDAERALQRRGGRPEESYRRQLPQAGALRRHKAQHGLQRDAAARCQRDTFPTGVTITSQPCQSAAGLACKPGPACSFEITQQVQSTSRSEVLWIARA